MASTVFTLPFIPALGTNGTTQSGAKLYFYDAGTTTPRAVYTDADLSVAHANPVVADGAGRFATIYLDPAISYRVILKDSAGVELGDIDNFSADSGLRADLAATSGSNLVGYLDGSLADKLGEFVTVEDYGAVGDGVTDDAAAVQAAITANYGKAIRFLGKKYKLGSTLAINGPIQIDGVFPSGKINNTDDYGGGTSLWFDHTGKGIEIKSVGTVFNGVAIRNLGTRRTQPASTGGWVPTDHDYDISVYGVSDVDIENVLMLNATRGVGLLGDLVTPTPTGRIYIHNLRGQFFKMAVFVQTAFDVVRIDQLHSWPFWTDDANTQAYTKANLDVIYSQRNDNPLISNIFSIYARSLLRLGQNALGGTALVKATNLDVDNGKHCIWVDNSVTSGASGQFENVTFLGAPSLAGSKFLFVEGNNSRLDFGNVSTNVCADSVVKLAGATNVVSFGTLTSVAWDQSASGAAAIDAAATNEVDFLLKPTLVPNGTTVGGRYATTGIISVDEWFSYTPVVTPSAGAITSAVVSGRYRRTGNTVEWKASHSNTNNGTGSGLLQVTLPFPPALADVGFGRNKTSGNMLQADVQAAGSALVLTYNNAYPTATGQLLEVGGTYQI